MKRLQRFDFLAGTARHRLPWAAAALALAVLTALFWLD